MDVREIATDENWFVLYSYLCRRVFWNFRNWICRWARVYNQCEMLYFIVYFLFRYWFAVSVEQTKCGSSNICLPQRSVRSYLIWSVETANRFLYKLMLVISSSATATATAAFDWIQLCVFIVFALAFSESI